MPVWMKGPHRYSEQSLPMSKELIKAQYSYTILFDFGENIKSLFHSKIFFILQLSKKFHLAVYVDSLILIPALIFQMKIEGSRSSVNMGC